ncbi:hypothetical protein BD311DRAFT_770166 [Dichomitus squalens]|uniref:MYND-type domain-containing protein n=1 Tax=Dichomitus squalens TaxID=114155 RepID=A0A4Q9M8T5_9APHY|nr:hypothetical protein BD311DRAFT_770166 [Dichomitus squalens]
MHVACISTQNHGFCLTRTVYHHANPIHSHAHCSNCLREPHYTLNGSDLVLFRCNDCGMRTYCSKECQVADRRRH